MKCCAQGGNAHFFSLLDLQPILQILYTDTLTMHKNLYKYSFMLLYYRSWTGLVKMIPVKQVKGHQPFNPQRLPMVWKVLKVLKWMSGHLGSHCMYYTTCSPFEKASLELVSNNLLVSL